MVVNTLLALGSAWYGMLQLEVAKDGLVKLRHLLSINWFQGYVTPDPGLQAGGRMVHGLPELMEQYHIFHPGFKESH